MGKIWTPSLCKSFENSTPPPPLSPYMKEGGSNYDQMTGFFITQVFRNFWVDYSIWSENEQEQKYIN